MQKHCIECGASFDATNRKNARQFCGEGCRERARRRCIGIENGTYTGIRFPPRQDSCLECGNDMSGASPQSRYCSSECRRQRNRRDYRSRRKARIREAKGWGPGSLINCKLTGCAAIFQTDGIRKFCSQEHLIAHYRKVGPPGPDGTWTFPCPDCGQPAASGRARPARCHPCRVAHGRLKSVNLLTVAEIAKRDGTLCHICHRRVDMTLSGNDRMGPTVEHIICRSWDGFDPNQPHNEVLAHRECNTRRSNRQPSQMLLPLT